MGISIPRCLSNQNTLHSEHVDLTVSIHKHFKPLNIILRHTEPSGLNFYLIMKTKQTNVFLADFVVLDASLHLYVFLLFYLCEKTCLVTSLRYLYLSG